ncbi:MAG TPA: 50S ribosomal protein L5 [Feifaniaceae bacterium]|nr:50S ribosomal protein L5 [Feifaniaceae bacterium]
MAKKEAAAAAPKKKAAKQEDIKSFSGAPRLKEKYASDVAPAMKEKFQYENVMQIPRLDKIVLNMGLGSDKDNPKGIEHAVEELSLITGQKAIVTKAKKSVANFKVREGMNIGAKVTLRGDRMYYFADKLMNIVLPRVRDFRGVSVKSFDGRGNYALGLKEQLIFPEINYDDMDKVRGMDIVFVTTAKSDEEAKELLSLLGMPFIQG